MLISRPCIYVAPADSMRCLDILFDDKRVAIVFLMVWMVAVILLLQGVGLKVQKVFVKGRIAATNSLP